VTLVFLSIGYFLGGRIADRKPRFDLLYLFVFLAGLCVIFIPLIAPTILILSNPLGPRLGPLSSSLVLFSVPLALLGMVMPYAIKLKTEGLDTLGITAGNLYAIATLGSFVGTILTGFILIPSLDVDKIVYLISLLLFGIASGWFIIKKVYRGLIPIAVLLIFFSTFLPIGPKEVSGDDIKILYKTESMQGQIKVADIRGSRYLLLDGAIQTGIDKETQSSVLPYTYYLEMAVFMNPSAKHALCIGLGGGAVPKRFETVYGIDMVVVEIDPKMEEVARKFFGFGGDVYIQDGRYFVQNTDKRYDIIILDAYSGYTPPAHLFTREMFEEINKKLAEDGVLAVTTLGFFGDELDKSIFYTLKAVFPHVYVFPVKRGLGNIVFFATNNERSEEEIAANIDLICKDDRCRKGFSNIWKTRREIIGDDVQILTDNYNPTEFLALDASEAWRELNYQYFGDEVLLGGVR
jgi:spermidine synthase